MTSDGTLIGKIIADITGIVVRDVLQELRPDILFASEMPEFVSELKGLEPSSIKDTIMKAIKEN
jgi:hypothetical protein